MVYKKMKLRKSVTLTSTIITLLFIIGIFFAGYLYLQGNLINAGLEMDEKYVSTYENLTDARDKVQDNINEMKGNFSTIVEAPSIYNVAINGFKGLGAVLKMPFRLLNALNATWNAIFYSIAPFTPPWLKVIIDIILVAFFLLLLLKIFKGEPGM